MRYSLTSEFLEHELTGTVSGTTVHLSEKASFSFEQDEHDQSVLYLVQNGVRRPIIIMEDEDTTIKLSINGYTYSIDALSERDAHFQHLLKETSTATSGSMKVVAPMPGLLKSINVKLGQTVKKGERLFILEAMKMENDIKSPMAGIVSNLHAESGTAVEKNFLLCMIDTAQQEG